MSCLKSTTYWVSLFHILHVKYGIKRPNSLSFFFIILASDRYRLPVHHKQPRAEPSKKSSNCALQYSMLYTFWEPAVPDLLEFFSASVRQRRFRAASVRVGCRQRSFITTGTANNSRLVRYHPICPVSRQCVIRPIDVVKGASERST